jgi:hypothetical protein
MIISMTSEMVTIRGDPARAPRDRAQQAGNPGLGAAAGEGRGALGARDAVHRAVRGLEGAAPALVLTFAGGALAADDVAEQAACAAGDVRVVGMTGTATIGAGGPADDGCVAVALDAAAAVGTGSCSGPRATCALPRARRRPTPWLACAAAGRPC